jgi:hypothetical protein
MIRKLGHRARLLLIVDGVSERSVSAASEAAAVFSNGEFTTVVITARTPGSKTAGFSETHVGPLEQGQLKKFILELYSDSRLARRIVPILKKLSAGAPIRPLFVRLLAARSESDRTAVTTYPGLIQEYVMELAPSGPSTLRSSEFLRAARVSARFCTLANNVPQPVDLRSLFGYLAAQKPPFLRSDGTPVNNESAAEVLDQLIVSGVLQREILLGVEYVRFAEDVVAEYLTAMDVIAESGPTEARRLAGFVRVQNQGLAEALDRVSQQYSTLLKAPH